MELAEVVGVPLLELIAEETGEELVVAVALAAVVERDEEEILALQLGKALGGVDPSGQGVAQGCRERVED